MRALIWFRRDLRVSDQEAVKWARDRGYETIAIAFSPPCAKDPASAKLRFFQECIEDLRISLEAYRIPLFVSERPAAEEIPRLASQHRADEVLVTEETHHRGHEEERAAQRALEQALPDCVLRRFEQRTLLKAQELPFAIQDLPLVFTAFRKRLEAHGKPAPRSQSDERGQAIRLDCDDGINPDHEPHKIRGGERAGRKRLHEYVWETNSVAHYAETRNGMLEFNDSSKLSPWLAWGCLSPRQVYDEIWRYETQYGVSRSTTAFIHELLWRDYFKFLAAKIGPALLDRNGLRGRDQNQGRAWREDRGAFFGLERGPHGPGFYRRQYDRAAKDRLDV